MDIHALPEHLRNKRVPVVTTHPTDPEDQLLNPAALIRFCWEVDLAAMLDAEKREAVRRWRARVQAIIQAGAVMAHPPTLDEVLWTHGHGEEVDALLVRGADGEPVDTSTIFALILREP